MKTWQFWVLVLVFIFVVVPLIYFAVIAKNVAKVVDQTDMKILGGNPANLTVVSKSGY